MVWGSVARTAEQVAKALADFLDGSGREWDWDDFTSVPIGNDSELEEIREEADSIPLPVNEAGRAKLRMLLERAIKMTKDN